jgi:hypothetical protein
LVVVLCFLKEGRYEYKYIVDGNWVCNQNEQITKPNADGHVNNFIQVRPRGTESVGRAKQGGTFLVAGLQGRDE